MVNMNYRWGLEFSMLKNLVTKGAFGEIYYLKARYLRNSTFNEKIKKTSWFANKERAGGGALFDIGVHILDLGLWFLDDFEPVSVYASVYQKFHQEVDDFTSALIKFKDGKTLSLETCWEAHLKDRLSLSILGTKAGSETSPLKTYEKHFGIPCETDYHLPSDTPAEKTSVGHFVSCVKERKKPEPSGEMGVKVMRILEAIYRSSQTGREVILK